MSDSTPPRLSASAKIRTRSTTRRAAPLEPYQRETLTNAIHLRFQNLHKDSGPPPLYALASSVEAKRAELQQILSVDIPANRKAIEEARAMGDLRENFEYKSARQRHEYLNSRAAALNGDLSRVRLIETDGTDLSEVRIGSQLHLVGVKGGGKRVLTILGPWESKPEEDVISYESDLAKELLGKKPGDAVSLGGESWTIEKIEPFR
jgi:transcription elongation GreA/GreB family factor